MPNWEIYEETFESFSVSAMRHKKAHKANEYSIFIRENGSFNEIYREDVPLSKYKELVDFLKDWDK